MLPCPISCAGRKKRGERREEVKMNWEHEGKVYEDCAVFFKVDEEFGGLSNMASGFPLCVNGHTIWSSEALFQACHFPDHADIQKEIIEQRSPMAAKMKARKDGRRSRCGRPDWYTISLDVLDWCLRVKLAQNFVPFYWLLELTGDRAIVERSHKDTFYGCKLADDGVLRGQNHLGRLLMRLREHARAHYHTDRDVLRRVEPLDIPNFKLLGEPIPTIIAPSASQE